MSEKSYTRLYEKDFTPIKYFWQRFFTYLFFIPFFSIFYKITVSGKENIPKGKKIICAPNHISFLDPFLVYIATKKPMAFMAKQELFSNKFMAWILPKLCAFAVNRQKLEVSTIKTVKDVMKTKDWNLCIFPQGGIFRNKKIEKINRGFIVIAKMSKTNILPLSITGSEHDNWIPFKGKIELKVGTPISYELPEEEIYQEWAKQITLMTGYEYVSDVSTDNAEKIA